MKRRGLTRTEKQILLQFYDDANDGPLPAHYQEHELRDEWAGYWECHLDSDWLVIYKRKGNRLILHRTGTHNELFNK